ncbi:MAG: IPT/TIG domain-containing protein [Nitrosomonas sp.]|nr:IPT/TIG domain-containing protein [Nitrosomonas sp.]
MNSTYTISVLIRISYAYLIILIFAFASTPQAIAGTLTVHNGSGSGSYPASTKVTIWANPQEDANPLSTTRAPLDANLPMRIFDRWIGDTAQIADVESPQTSVTMPASDINITAQYKDAPRWLDVVTYFPDPHIGVIFMFHGMGGCAACFFDQTETRSFIQDATARGYAIVALNSYDRQTRAWNLEIEPANNPDLQRVAALRQALVAQGSINPADPIYLAGISSGGFFASLFTQSVQDYLKFPVEAMALYIASGNWNSILSASTPTIFVTGVNDTLIPYNTIQKSYGLLLSMGIPTQLISSTPSQLYPERFWRIEGLSALDSQTIYNAIDNAGFLDGNGYLLSNPTTSGWEAILPAIYEFYKYQVSNQLEVAFAEHSFMGHLNKPVFDFFANPVTVINVEPSISEFTPASGPPSTQITITGNNFVDVQSVAIGGITARFTVISPTEIWAYVPTNPMSGPITVTNSVSVATSASNFVVGSPLITSFAPSTGGSGTLVTITGDNLNSIEAVAFNGVTASFSSLGSKTLTSTVPIGATTGPITVTTSQGTVVSEADMILFPPPAITAMAPSQGAIGTLVTITGSHFTPTTSVKFSGIEANFTVVSDTEITSTVPVGTPTFSRITVITPSGYTSSPTYFRIK